jgi:hypothetical protein
MAWREGQHDAGNLGRKLPIGPMPQIGSAIRGIPKNTGDSRHVIVADRPDFDTAVLDYDEKLVVSRHN